MRQALINKGLTPNNVDLIMANGRAKYDEFKAAKAEIKAARGMEGSFDATVAMKPAPALRAAMRMEAKAAKLARLAEPAEPTPAPKAKKSKK